MPYCNSSLQPVRVFRESVSQQRRELERLVLSETVLDDRRRQEAARYAAPDVVPSRDRHERPGVVVEADRVVEACGLDDLREEALHPLEAVVEPPRRPELEDR